MSRKIKNPKVVLQLMAKLFTEAKYTEAIVASKKFKNLCQNKAQFHLIVGLCELKLGNYESAVVALLKCSNLEPFNIGHKCNLAVAFQKVGELDQAEILLKEILQLEPFNISAICTLGNVYSEKQLIKQALYQFEMANKHSPNTFSILYSLANNLMKSQQFDKAIEKFKLCQTLNPMHADLALEYGKALQKSGKTVEAIEQYKICLQLEENAIAHRNIAIAYKDIGTIELAIKHLEAGLAIDPDNLECFRNLTVLKKYDFSDPIVQKISKISPDSLTDENQTAFYFAFTEIYEELGDYQKAFHHLQQGNRARRRSLPYSLEQDVAHFCRLTKTQKKLKKQTLQINEPAKCIPIFVVGMPRSGTSLVEKILSCHSDISAAGELEELRKIGGKIAETEGAVSGTDLKTIREKYMDLLSTKSNGRKFVVDKMPNNFKYLPLIMAAMPEAKVIIVERNKYAVSWSNYRTHFGNSGLRYCYNLDDTVRYYKMFESMALKWLVEYGDKVYSLSYERLTENTKVEIENLVEYLGVGWETAMLAPEKSTIITKTASQFQVQKPIYRGSSDFWRHYEELVKKEFSLL